QPDGPRNTTNSPERTCRETSAMTCVRPKDLLMFLSSMSATRVSFFPDAATGKLDAPAGAFKGKPSAIRPASIRPSRFVTLRALLFAHHKRDRRGTRCHRPLDTR